MTPEYHRGYWNGLDAVLNLLNSLDVPISQTADEMRRRIYGLVMALKPK